MGVSVQPEEGSLKGKVEREKKVLGPVSGELVWRQVWELNHAVKELHGSHDVLILLAGLQELLDCHHAILIPVHFLEEVLHVLPGCFLPHGWVGVFAHHVVDGLHDVQHFLFGDTAIFVQVIEVESPVQAIINGAPKDGGQPRHKVLEADGAIMVGVKGVEEEGGIGAGVSLREEL